MTQVTPLSLKAAIHIGASSISLLVVDAHPDADASTGEFLEQSVSLARDVFQRGSVRKSTIERCVTIIKGYRDTLSELGASDDTPIRVVATNVLSEASNQDAFLNRIQIGCGLKVEPLDEGEMTRLIYLKTRRRLKDMPSMIGNTTLVLHVGPANTRALLFKKGRISRYSNYRLGVYRTSQSIDVSTTEHEGDANIRKIIQENIRSQVSQIHHDYADAGIEEIVLMGYEIQHIAEVLAKPGKRKNSFVQLQEASSQIASMSEEQRVRSYQLDYNTAHAIVPALEINLAIAMHLNIQTLRIPGSDYEKGLLLDIPTTFSLTEGFRKEVIRSAESLAKKFRVHRAHSTQVAKLSKQIYDATHSLHELDEHDALLLRCAAIVHECGNYISTRSHHKHSQYIIQHSEIFGLGQKDINIVAQIARYHRKSGPKLDHSAYRDLGALDRMRVSKLAAILRIADALDHSHSSRIGNLAVAINHRKQKLEIELLGIEDASVERLAMRDKSSLFHDIYGLRVALSEGAI
ncbi:MAG: Ppx/GppA phosphatase family protein [Akkermansiaceae bacterium]